MIRPGFKSFLAGLSSASGLFLLVMSLANFYLAYRAAQVVNLRSYTVTNLVEVVSTVPTNTDSVVSSPVSFSSPSFSSPSPDTVNPPVPREVAQWPYRYFLVGRRIGFEVFGRYYYEGSPCSYGRIYQIYPDRILLCGGDWISNRISSDVARKDVRDDK